MPLGVALLAAFVTLAHGLAQTEGRVALDEFRQWQRLPANAALEWGDALTRYRQELVAKGASEAMADRTIRLVVAYDEAEGYNKIYAGTPEFDTKPNRFLVEAVEGLRPGKALDVDMGQGRNAIYLASRGWDVTGFDVADAGLEKARAQAAAAGVTINAVHASDEEFDFGRERWDLIAIIYALEYEETVDAFDWGPPEKIRLVRLVAQKPR
jgi:2-polyprenyl-3-methyl-5-hydroxy-6-metoxy-1,4-benzoquinol methylase